jgi:hypothetical protein
VKALGYRLITQVGAILAACGGGATYGGTHPLIVIIKK